jgi:hypothetical protein
VRQLPPSAGVNTLPPGVTAVHVGFLKSKSRRPRKPDQAWSPNSLVEGNLAANFSRFPIAATMAGPVYAAIPLRYAPIFGLRPRSAQGNFSAGAGELSCGGKQFIRRDGNVSVNDEFMPRRNVTPLSKCALANTPIPLKR